MADYKRFFKVFNRMPGHSDETRKAIIRDFTNGRKDSLKALTAAEYDLLCRNMERSFKDPRAGQRSVCLKLMQQLGIDTTDWNRINSFCENARIAGIPFAEIKMPGLVELERKLRSIQRSGGLKPSPEPEPQPETSRQAVLFIPPFRGLTN